MDRGDLVPDEVIIAVIGERVQREEAPTASSSMASRARCPRPRPSTRRWRTSGASFTAAILIDVPEEEVVRRLGGRRTCEENPSHIYHVEFDPPKKEGVCDIDGGKLIVRDDDKPEVIKNRLDQYRREDRAADRLLRGARHPPARRRRAGARRGRREIHGIARDARREEEEGM